MAQKPSELVLERAKDTLQERYDASEKLIDSHENDWQEYRKLYQSTIDQRSNKWESNLIMPKGDQIIETISPRIMSTVFGAADWLTIKNPKFNKFADNDLRDFCKFLTYIHDKKIRFYLMCTELFKDSPIVGTSLCKIYPKGRWPANEFVRVEDFGPDALCNKPGDVDSMRYCYHKFERSLEQLRRFIDANAEPVYFNLDKLDANYTNYAKKTIRRTNTRGEEVSVPEEINPIFDIVEYHGEFQSQKNGRFEEYVLTAVAYDGDIREMIRCSPSGNKIWDPLEKRIVYYKPFVASIYQVVPGQFYGKSALHAVRSLIAEQKEHHDLFLDQHKRNLTNIIQVLNRSNLTEDDLIRRPDAIWWLDNHDDVKVVETPDLNIQSFSIVHDLINREIERTSRANPNVEGIGLTKRQTLGEFEGLRSESNMVFNLFIQLADRLTLRPIVARNYNIMRQTLQGSQQFPIEDKYITVNPIFFDEETEFQFAATGVETEYSKYAKRQTIPQLLSSFAQILQADPTYAFDLPKLTEDIGDLFEFPNAGEYVKLRSGIVPIDLLMQATPPELQGIMQNVILPAVEQLANPDEESQGGGGRQ